MDAILEPLSREMECARAADNLWAVRIPCCEVGSMHLTIHEILQRIVVYGMSITYEFPRQDSNLFRLTLRQVENHNIGQGLQFDFVRMGDHYYLQDIHGLCELLTRLSLADHEQCLSQEFKES